MEKISLQKIKWLRGLRIKKNRDELSLFVVEGEKIVKELIDQHAHKINFILSSQDLFEQLGLNQFENAFVGTASDFEKVTSLTTPPKIIAVASKIELKEIENKNRIIVLDGIQDPGNLGTIIRTADWFGFNQVICSQTTVDRYNQKVIQSSMGSIFRVNVIYENLPKFLKNLDCPIHGALLQGTNLNEIKSDDIKVLVLGSEGQGISNEVLPYITNPVAIAGSGNAESLNVGTAAGIFLHYWTR